MFVQLVSEVERLVAVFAVVGERARKVNILNVVLRVGPLPINHSARKVHLYFVFPSSTTFSMYSSSISRVNPGKNDSS